MSDYRYVRLLKNRLYPTNQLFAQMASKKTAPEDGLRLAALSCLEWLCRRLGEEAPGELRDIPAPSEYKNAAFSASLPAAASEGRFDQCLKEPAPRSGENAGRMGERAL